MNKIKKMPSLVSIAIGIMAILVPFTSASAINPGSDSPVPVPLGPDPPPFATGTLWGIEASFGDGPIDQLDMATNTVKQFTPTYEPGFGNGRGVAYDPVDNSLLYSGVSPLGAGDPTNLMRKHHLSGGPDTAIPVAIPEGIGSLSWDYTTTFTTPHIVYAAGYGPVGGKVFYYKVDADTGAILNSCSRPLTPKGGFGDDTLAVATIGNSKVLLTDAGDSAVLSTNNLQEIDPDTCALLGTFTTPVRGLTGITWDQASGDLVATDGTNLLNFGTVPFNNIVTTETWPAPVAKGLIEGITLKPLPRGSISGTKYNDLNGDGTRETGELGLKDWKIVLTDSTSATTTMTTAADGSYSFPNLADGNYAISEVLQSGWMQTQPKSGTYQVTISGGKPVTGEDFGNFQLGSVSGTKFEDLNANGKRDQNEIGLANWKINIKGLDTITGQPVDETVTTDPNGNYNFGQLTAGNYAITETLQPGWVQTLPMGGNYAVTIQSGSVITSQDFGNFHKGDITGGGWISIPKGDTKATFGIVGHYPDSSNIAQGSVQYQDHVAGLNVKSTKINTVATTLDKKKGVITGIAQVNGAGTFPFEVYVEDNGEPGAGVDVFRISLPTLPYSSGAPLVLSSGNIQIKS